MRQHQPTITLSKQGQYWRDRARHDGRLPMRRCGWDCQHEEQCTDCGKVMTRSRRLTPRQCPEYHDRVDPARSGE